jgi:hypothetical protein
LSAAATIVGLETCRNLSENPVRVHRADRLLHQVAALVDLSDNAATVGDFPSRPARARARVDGGEVLAFPALRRPVK